MVNVKAQTPFNLGVLRYWTPIMSNIDTVLINMIKLNYMIFPN